jgi:hypothetical protein
VVRVEVTSARFTNALTLSSADLLVMPEADRVAAAFEQEVAGKKDSSFARDAKGGLVSNPDAQPNTPATATSGLESEIDVVKGLRKADQIDDKKAETFVEGIEGQRAALKEVSEAGRDKTAYVVDGVFVSREDSSVKPLEVFLYRMDRSGSHGECRYEVTLFDVTGSQEEAARHPGVGSAPFTADDRHDFALAERNALTAMAAHFHAHNELDLGTVRLAIKQLEDGSAFETSFDTNNATKRAEDAAKQAAMIMGAVGVGAIALGSSGILAPEAMAAVVVVAQVSADVGLTASATEIGLEVAGRYMRNGKLAWDKETRLDLAAAVALCLAPAFESFLGEAAELGPYKVIPFASAVAVDGSIGYMLTNETIEQIRQIRASYAVGRARDGGKQAFCYTREDEEAQVRQALVAAAVSSAFIVITLSREGTETFGEGEHEEHAHAEHAHAEPEPAHGEATEHEETPPEALQDREQEVEGQAVALSAMADASVLGEATQVAGVSESEEPDAHTHVHMRSQASAHGRVAAAPSNETAAGLGAVTAVDVGSARTQAARDSSTTAPSPQPRGAFLDAVEQLANDLRLTFVVFGWKKSTSSAADSGVRVTYIGVPADDLRVARSAWRRVPGLKKPPVRRCATLAEALASPGIVIMPKSSNE